MLSVVGRGVEADEGRVRVEVRKTREELGGVLGRCVPCSSACVREEKERNAPALTPRVSPSPSPDAPPRLPEGSANTLLTSSVPFESIPRSWPTAGEKETVAFEVPAGAGTIWCASRECLMIFMRA